jgi:lipid-A-disaccharide synthase
MKVVFSFEVEIYEKEQVNVEFVGHPLAERIRSSRSRDEFFGENRFDPSKKLVGLLPGSRRQEIEKIFPTMLAAATVLEKEMDVHVAVGVAPNIGSAFLRQFLGKSTSVRLVENATYDVMAHSDAAIVTSGTATLETGWFGTPMSVVYKTSSMTYAIGRMLVGLPFIGLVNIVAGEKIVPEFVQHDMNVENLLREVRTQLSDASYAEKMRWKLSVIKAKLGGPGASARVAEGILELGDAA